MTDDIASSGLSLEELSDAAVRFSFARPRTRPGHEIVLRLRVPSVARRRVRGVLLHTDAPEAQAGFVDAGLSLDSAIAAEFECELDHDGVGESIVRAPMRPLSATERKHEAYQLVAALRPDDGSGLLRSSSVEVVVSPFAFGL